MNKVGGQAVLEGVMMKGGENVALAVRSEDGTIKLDTKKHVSVRKKYKICRVPVIRGAVNMVETFMLSYSTLEKSAEMLGIDTSEPETKFEKWLTEKLGDSIMKGVTFNGSGWGHSLGMSQFGAYAMAKVYGFTYDQIVNFYYTDITLASATYTY